MQESRFYVSITIVHTKLAGSKRWDCGEGAKRCKQEKQLSLPSYFFPALWHRAEFHYPLTFLSSLCVSKVTITGDIDKHNAIARKFLKRKTAIHNSYLHRSRMRALCFNTGMIHFFKELGRQTCFRKQWVKRRDFRKLNHHQTKMLLARLTYYQDIISVTQGQVR